MTKNKTGKEKDDVVQRSFDFFYFLIDTTKIKARKTEQTPKLIDYSLQLK